MIMTACRSIELYTCTADILLIITSWYLISTVVYCKLTMGNQHSNEKPDKKVVEFGDIEEKIETGDLALLYRGNQEIPQFAVFIQHDKEDIDFPLMLVKGKTKPLPAERFNPSQPRNFELKTAVTRIFYGDFSKVIIHRSVLANAGKGPVSCKDATALVDEVEKIPFEEKEIAAINGAKSDVERRAVLNAFTVAHFYKKLGVLKGDPSDATPATLEGMLQFSEPICVKVPPLKPGPVINREAPLLIQVT